MIASRLRVYTVDGSTLKLVGGTPNTTGHTVQVAVGHFSDFLLAEGSVIYPAAVTEAFIGEALTVQASVVNYLPARAATLYYRRGSGGWQSLSMAQNGWGSSTLACKQAARACPVRMAGQFPPGCRCFLAEIRKLLGRGARHLKAAVG